MNKRKKYSSSWHLNEFYIINMKNDHGDGWAFSLNVPHVKTSLSPLYYPSHQTYEFIEYQRFPLILLILHSGAIIESLDWNTKKNVYWNYKIVELVSHESKSKNNQIRLRLCT